MAPRRMRSVAPHTRPEAAAPRPAAAWRKIRRVRLLVITISLDHRSRAARLLGRSRPPGRMIGFNRIVRPFKGNCNCFLRSGQAKYRTKFIQNVEVSAFACDNFLVIAENVSYVESST